MKSRSSSLLISEQVLVVQPSLAVLLGLNEAIFLQQLHYWINLAERTNSGRVDAGQRWVYKTIADWKSENFSFWSERTIQTVISNLKIAGAIDVKMLSEDSRDRTNFYTIDYEWLRDHDADSASPMTQDLRHPNKTEITSEINEQSESASHVLEVAFGRFWVAGMRKVDRKKALSAFKSALKRSGMAAEDFAASLEADVKGRVSKQLGFDQMHPTTYLNGERWTDELPVGDLSPAKPKKAEPGDLWAGAL